MADSTGGNSSSREPDPQAVPAPPGFDPGRAAFDRLTAFAREMELRQLNELRRCALWYAKHGPKS